MPATPENTMSELFDQAAETFGGALKAGVQMQANMSHWWTEAFGQMGAMQEWQRKSRAVISEAIPAAQKNADEALKLMDQGYRANMDLLKRAMATAKSTSPTEVQAKTEDFCEAAITALRSGTKAMAQANVRAMEAWTEFFRKNLDIDRPVGKSSSK